MFLARWDRHLVGKKWKVLISNLIFFAPEQERRKGIIRTVSAFGLSSYYMLLEPCEKESVSAFHAHMQNGL